MEPVRHEKFSYGIIRDGDSLGRPGYKEMLNLDPVPGLYNKLTFRKPCHYYTSTNVGRAAVETLNGDGGLPNNMPAFQAGLAKYSVWELFYWESGTEVPQYNAMLIYRSNNATSTVGSLKLYTWQIYTNAPALTLYNLGTWTGPVTAQQDWTLLEDGIIAPVCVPDAIGSMVSVSLGNADRMTGRTNDYRVFIDLLNDSTERNYFIRNTDWLYKVNKQLVTAVNNYGAGGRIVNGWYWDYGKLYSPFIAQMVGTPAVSTYPVKVTPNFAKITGTSKNALDGGDWGFLVAPVYDNDTEQIGVPYYIFMPSTITTTNNGITSTTSIFSLNDTVIKLTLTTELAAQLLPPYGGEYYLDMRITGFNIYGKRTNYSAGDMPDFLYLGNVPVAEIGTSAGFTFYVDRAVVDGALVRSWIGDTGGADVGGVQQGRPVTTDGLTDNIGSFSAGLGPFPFYYQSSNAVTIGKDLAAITIKCAGMVSRKELRYAWGVDGDAGQMKIRQSEQPSNRGMYDVWPQDAVTWKPGATEAITYLMLVDDRLYQFHENAVYHLEVKDKERARPSYFYVEDSAGVGLPSDFIPSITRGRTGIFFANPSGIWVLRSGKRAESIIEGYWLETYQAWVQTWLTQPTKESFSPIAGYYDKLDQLWIVLPQVTQEYEIDENGLPSTPVATSMLNDVWVWDDRDVQEKFWRHYSFVAGPANDILGFTADRFGNFVACGKGNLFVPHYQKTDTIIDFGGRFLKKNQYVLESNGIGDDAAESVLENIDIARDCDSRHKMIFDFLCDDQVIPPQDSTFPIAGDDDLDTLMTMEPARFKVMSWRIHGAFPQYANETMLPEISAINLFISTEQKRRG